MKIQELFEGRVKELVTSRQEDERLRNDPSIPTTYILELSFEGAVYHVRTTAKTPKQAVSNALYRVTTYLKKHYPQYRGFKLSKRDFGIKELESPEEGSPKAISV